VTNVAEVVRLPLEFVTSLLDGILTSYHALGHSECRKWGDGRQFPAIIGAIPLPPNRHREARASRSPLGISEGDDTVGNMYGCKYLPASGPVAGSL